MPKTVTFGMFYEMYGRVSIDIPDYIDLDCSNQKEQIIKYLNNIWNDIPLPKDAGYIPNSQRLDKDGIITIEETKIPTKKPYTSGNHMDAIADLLGLELFEKFNTIGTLNALESKMDGIIRNPYYFTDEGLNNRDGCLDNHKIAHLITGRLKIEKR